MNLPLTGLVAAPHTPFTPSGDLHLPAVEPLAAHLLGDGVTAVFVGGTTGECSSLTHAERRALARRWVDVARGTPMRVVVHVGGNCLADVRALAVEAAELGASAVAAVAPCYLRPPDVDTLVSICAGLAGAVPGLPFYYYDIPPLTGLQLDLVEFLGRAAAVIPNLAGLKYSNPDLVTYQRCLRVRTPAFDLPWGVDEALLGALAVGCRGAVGSTYNFAAPVAHRLLAAFDRGDLDAAREEQHRLVRLVGLLSAHGYLAASKAVMGLLGVDLGPVRLPLRRLAPEARVQLRSDLDALGFSGWRSAAAG